MFTGRLTRRCLFCGCFFVVLVVVLTGVVVDCVVFNVVVGVVDISVRKNRDEKELMVLVVRAMSFLRIKINRGGFKINTFTYVDLKMNNKIMRGSKIKCRKIKSDGFVASFLYKKYTLLSS